MGPEGLELLDEHSRRKSAFFFWCFAELFRCIITLKLKGLKSELYNRSELWTDMLMLTLPENLLTIRDITVPFNYAEKVQSIATSSMCLNVK